MTHKPSLGMGHACPNCHATLHGPWCSQCGQKQPSGRLTIVGLGRDLVARAVDIESGLVRTFVGLVRDPRATIQAWLDGRRKHYLHPFGALLVVATLTVLLLQVFGDAFWAEFRTTMGQMSGLKDDVPRERFVRFYELSYALMPYWMLLFVLPVAGLLRVLFPRRGYTVAEHWAACLFAVTLGILVDLPFSVIMSVLAVPVSSQLMVTNLLLVLAQILVLGRFLAAGWTGWLRVCLATITGFVMAAITTQVVAHAYAYA